MAETLPRVAADAVDEELLALPAPPRGRRLLAMTLMAAVVVMAMGVIAQLRDEIQYFFAADRAVVVGDAVDVDLSTLSPNTHVRVRGTPMLSGLVRFERSFSGVPYVVFPLAGQRQIFVQLPEHAFDDPQQIARGEFSGRLTTFGRLGARFRAVRAYMDRSMSMPVTAESFLIVAGEAPSDYAWALVLAVLCVAIIALNVWLMLRWFRVVRD